MKKDIHDISESELHRIEFFRHGLALIPDQADRRPGVAFFVVDSGPDEFAQRYCSCSISKTTTCAHILELVGIYKTLTKGLNGRGIDHDFRSSIWNRLAGIMGDQCKETLQAVRIDTLKSGDETVVKVYESNQDEALSYLSAGCDRTRFLERCGKTSEDDSVPNRATVLARLALMTLSENERNMNQAGFMTRRQMLEGGFWHRAAYHGYREFGSAGCTFHPAVEDASGSFTVTCKDLEGRAYFRMVIPPNKVKRILAAFKDLLPNQHHLAIHPIPLKSIFKITANTRLDLEIRPIIQLIQEDGEETFLEREDLERFRYGDLIYIKDLGILAELERPGSLERKFRSPEKMVLKKSQVPSFLEEHGDALFEASNLVDEKVRSLRIIKTFDRIEIRPEALDRDWCWLAVKYGFGNMAVSLAEIMSAKKEGQRYIGTDGGWVDCESPELDGLGLILDRYAAEELQAESKEIKLSRLDLFRLKASLTSPLDVEGRPKLVDSLKNLLELKSIAPLPKLKGMTSTLRPYQERGVEWIRFLFENRFGGLLCDDMGLGKTHEVIAFMLWLREYEGTRGPFLVVCPTTVLSHWGNKIQEHAPGLEPTLYHGGRRDLEGVMGTRALLLTSYGVLRRDIDKLKEIRFPLVIFDEIQNIKNPQTHAHLAAKGINALMKLGLTGTPIENRLSELKALFDLTLPGYLGADRDFETRFVKQMESDPSAPKAEELSRLISPFVLRRRKDTVLSDLPEKIEDIRTCELSDDQIKLYRDAIASRGKGLLQTLRNTDEVVPYMHIFALLSLLKQICNHPATVEDTVDNYDRYRSGKWELFKELLAESLDSGQKVVVYSQFLGMIRIIEIFLKKEGIEFAVLTGKSRNRGEIIERFNNDPECRVYVGSLMAGSTGIDLVAASVVIHYDRWWNAAKEDQATDRVHRIGQKRGVQVFKLVTEGTLEEKISAIIQKKRYLMDRVIKETDPAILKGFTKEELMELLSYPAEDISTDSQHRFFDSVFDNHSFEI